MKRLLLLLLLVGTCLMSHAERRALVVGIGNYPAAGGWIKIHGDEDIPLVEEMLLVNGFKKQNIVALKNEQATCRAIKQQLEKLITTATKGDVIYIHFSGHGQQITDLNGDEADGKDEAFIPYDAQFSFKKGKYEGENHLTDDQLNSYLHRLRQRIGKEGKIVVVADACHSGDITRADEDELQEGLVVRGTSTIFSIDNIKSAVNRFLRLFSKEVSVSERAHIEKPSNAPIEWLLISACESRGINQEYQGKGSLTTALYNNRASLSKWSIDQLRTKIGLFYKKNPTHVHFIQIPQFEYPEGGEGKMVL